MEHLVSIVDLAAISENPAFIKRCQTLSAEFDFVFSQYRSADDLFEDVEATGSVKCFILDCTSFQNIHQAAGTIQVSRQMMDRSYIVCILDSRVKSEDMELLKKSGANLIMLDSEFSENSKMEFVTSQVIKSAYIPVKVADLIAGSQLDCPLYMLLPLNKKFLKVYKPAQTITGEFISKFTEMQEIYIHRNDVPQWIAYIEKFPDQGVEGSKRNCRARYLKLQKAFLELVLGISDQTSSSSFSDGKDLFGDCARFAKDLLDSLAEIERPWEVISTSSIGDFGSVERGTAVAVYAGLLSRRGRIGKPEQVMLGALLADIGLLLVSPSTSRKVRLNRVDEMNGEERMEFEKHPIYSLNQVLSKRLPLEDEVKDIILMSHERADQKGFPARPAPHKIKEEPMLVRLAQEIDSALTLRIGEERILFDKIFNEFLDNKISKIDGYPLTLLFRLKPAFQNNDLQSAI